MSCGAAYTLFWRRFLRSYQEKGRSKIKSLTAHFPPFTCRHFKHFEKLSWILDQTKINPALQNRRLIIVVIIVISFMLHQVFEFDRYCTHRLDPHITRKLLKWREVGFGVFPSTRIKKLNIECILRNMTTIRRMTSQDRKIYQPWESSSSSDKSER